MPGLNAEKFVGWDQRAGEPGPPITGLGGPALASSLVPPVPPYARFYTPPSRVVVLGILPPLQPGKPIFILDGLSVLDCAAAHFKPRSVQESDEHDDGYQLRVRAGMTRAGSVLTCDERIKRLKDAERWKEGDSPYGLPKGSGLQARHEEEEKEGQGRRRKRRCCRGWPAAAAKSPAAKGKK